jgi:hypothetical protein
LPLFLFRQRGKSGAKRETQGRYGFFTHNLFSPMCFSFFGSFFLFTEEKKGTKRKETP